MRKHQIVGFRMMQYLRMAIDMNDEKFIHYQNLRSDAEVMVEKNKFTKEDIEEACRFLKEDLLKFLEEMKNDVSIEDSDEKLKNMLKATGHL